MDLAYLLQDLEYIYINGDVNKKIENLHINSKNVNFNSLFFCINGFNVDGHNFVYSAIENGAIAIVCEKDLVNIPSNITIIKVKNTRIALSKICMNFYDNPTSKFKLVGVTGTNGKTSTTYFLETILSTARKSTGIIGTIESRVNQKKIDFDFSTSTTPDTIELNQLFNKMINMDTQNIIMEVSSHALELEKVRDCNFEIGIFTNLTQDHLDLHKNMEKYCQAKSKLFNLCKFGIINLDDEYASKIVKNSNCKILTFSVKNKSDLQALNIKYFINKVTFDINFNNNIYNFELNVPARFNVYNALGAIGASICLGVPIELIQQGIRNIKGVPGRIQNIPNNKGFNVIVDYAHTPDGLKNIINAVREFTKGNVITVFGCGGDRDKKKRPIMARISGELSDYTIITSDNPRTENPEDIVKDIEKGILHITRNYETILSRRKAIFKAIKIAKPLDSIIIAGKGHENYEIFADKTIYFDDAEEAKKALEEI